MAHSSAFLLQRMYDAIEDSMVIQTLYVLGNTLQRDCSQAPANPDDWIFKQKNSIGWHTRDGITIWRCINNTLEITSKTSYPKSKKTHKELFFVNEIDTIFVLNYSKDNFIESVTIACTVKKPQKQYMHTVTALITEKYRIV